jgi:hypothetical protein
MPQVPYQPFSTATPQSSGERLNVSTPPAAFGENIGAALEQLGTTSQHVGDELFTRAIALQDLHNETVAREAQSKYAEQASLLHAQYGSLEGKAAADALPGYIKAQTDLRQSVRGTLGTANAQRMYDQDTLPFMQRNIFSAAGHAADQNKRWVVGTAEANMDTAARTFADPKSEAEFNHKLDQVKSQVPTIAAARGWGPEQESDYLFKRTSNLRLGQIGSLAHDDPQTALTMLDEHKAEMTQEDFEKAQIVARAQNRAVGSVNLVQSVYSPDKTAGQMEQEVKDKSATLAHGDPLFEKDSLTQLRSKIANQRYFDKQDQDAGMQKVYEALQGGVTDVRELRLKPGMAQTIDSLPPKVQAMIPGLIASYNDKRDKQGKEDRFTELWGLSYNDREKFLDTDPTKENLSNAQMNRLITRRAAVLKAPTDDPHLAKAQGWMLTTRAPELRALGLIKGDPSFDANAYDHYTGALASAIDAWRQDHGSPPGYKDMVETIGPSVIRQRTEGGWGGWFGTKRPFFDQDISKAKEWADKTNLVSEIVNRGGSPPTDEEILRAFMRTQFIDLYSKGGTSGGPAAPGTK